MDRLMKMAQSVALFRSTYIRSSLNVLSDSGSYRVLILVCNFDEGRGIKPNQVADYFHCTRPYISKVAKGLIQNGYIHKKSDPEDNRSSFFTCTPKGRKIVESIMEEYLQVTKKLFHGLGEKKSDMLVVLLDEAIGILEADGRNGGAT